MIEIDTVAELTALLRDTFPLAGARDIARLVAMLCAAEAAAQDLGGSLRFCVDGWPAAGSA